jgi:hypothetical protein
MIVIENNKIIILVKKKISIFFASTGSTNVVNTQKGKKIIKNEK